MHLRPYVFRGFKLGAVWAVTCVVACHVLGSAWLVAIGVAALCWVCTVIVGVVVGVFAIRRGDRDLD